MNTDDLDPEIVAMFDLALRRIPRPTGSLADRRAAMAEPSELARVAICSWAEVCSMCDGKGAIPTGDKMGGFVTCPGCGDKEASHE